MARQLLSGIVAILMAATAVAQETAEKSNEELAKELANPNTPLASIKNKVQYRSYEGGLPNADDQDSTTLLFQPTLPFPFESGRTLYLRPGIPLIMDQPVFDPKKADFDSKFGLGDSTVDLQYGATEESGFLWSFGATTTIPTATATGLGGERWGLGPGFQLGQITKKSVLGGFLNHQWDLGGSGPKDINLTTLQLFAIHLPGGGWNMGSAPIMSYDHVTDESTIPLNLLAGKTVKINGRPWKFAIELNYYVEHSDDFGPEWMIGFNITPVVQNKLANWFK